MDEKKGRHKAGHIEKTQSHSTKNSSFRQRHIAAERACPNGAGLRIFSYVSLAEKPVSTAELANYCAVGNVADAVARVNNVIRDFDLQILHKLPVKPFQNRFGDASPMHIWWLQDVAIGEAGRQVYDTSKNH